LPIHSRRVWVWNVGSQGIKYSGKGGCRRCHGFHRSRVAEPSCRLTYAERVSHWLPSPKPYRRSYPPAEPPCPTWTNFRTSRDYSDEISSMFNSCLHEWIISGQRKLLLAVEACIEGTEMRRLPRQARQHAAKDLLRMPLKTVAPAKQTTIATNASREMIARHPNPAATTSKAPMIQSMCIRIGIPRSHTVSLAQNT
jgi:hypothetical protein